MRRVATLDLFDQLDETSKRYPYVPLAEGLIDSPGTTLAYRLPITRFARLAAVRGGRRVRLVECRCFGAVGVLRRWEGALRD